MMLTAVEALSDTGPFSELIDDYQARDSQLGLAEAITEAINNKASLIAEAGTGTGKTFAYLVPAILSGNKVLISTGTKHLQDQIYQKDLPVVLDALKKSVNISLLKGRANYYCPFYAEQSLSETANAKIRQEITDVQDWARSREVADLNDVLPDRSPLFQQLSSTAENCLGQDCEYIENCHVMKARRRALAADVVVVNHHLLLADMGLRDVGFGELLPEVNTIIFDEAHQLPELASQFFGSSLSGRQIFDFIQDCRRAYLEEANDVPEFIDQLSQLETALKKFRACFLQTEQRKEWHVIKANPDVSITVTDMLDAIAITEKTLSLLSERGNQLETVHRRSISLYNWLNSYLSETSQEYIRWFEIRGRGFLFHQTPLLVADLFQQRLNQYECHAVYTSATLAVGSSFNHFTEQLGLGEVDARQWESPFDYKTQSLLYIPRDMPDPNAFDYTRQVVECAIPVLQSSQGRAFMLFTSHRALQNAYQLLQGKLDYPLLMQGNESRTELLNRFREDEHSILLATAGFWEGVDVKGSSLSCVIIDKLPFAMPDDPVLRARGNVMKQQGKNVFMEYQLPKAVIQLKQGVGRLIRDHYDTGVMMICDPRLSTKSYGKIFLKSLPGMPVSSELADVIDFYKNTQSLQMGYS